MANPLFGLMVVLLCAVEGGLIDQRHTKGLPRTPATTGTPPDADCTVFIDVSCENGTATLALAANITKELKDCEGGLLVKNNLLADAAPFGKAKESKLIKKATYWNLTILSCPPEIHWKLSCNIPRVEILACYRITTKTSPEQTSQCSVASRGNRLLLLFPVALFVIALMVLIGSAVGKRRKEKSESVV